MRIKHGGVVDMFPLAGHQCLNGQRLNVDIRLHQGGEVRWQCADACGCDTIAVDEAGNFHASAVRQIVDQAMVGNIAVDRGWASRDDGAQDTCAVFA